MFAVVAQRNQKQAAIVAGQIFIQNRLFQRFERVLVQVVGICPNGFDTHGDILVFQKLGKNIVAMLFITAGQSGDFQSDGRLRIVRQRRDDFSRFFCRNRRAAILRQSQCADFLRIVLEELHKTLWLKRFRKIPRGGQNIAPHGEIFIVQSLVEDEQGFGVVVI